jgi:SAM-dependent methyltransferase
MDIAESQNDGLLSMANLRFGALMTSKWLSFGRVLFSPVHFELKDPNEDRVLVIDGLGKDWSYYCALTYPEATVYDMGPDPSSTTSSEGASEPWSTLRNHRHICHPSLGKAFPFPMHFFACVVLRFPIALPSSEHRFILSEAKRVLRPGGYLEFSVLDMDLVNMGNRARRAVRGLKMRMQVADNSISLRNISDEVMAGIGRKGFVECNRCVVGVPVAGKLPSLDDVKRTTTKRKGSTASSASNTNNTMPLPKGPKPEVSFSDLLNASSSSESTDNGITDMVARVGRWWYSRCYESLVLPEAGEPGAATSGNLLENSIWRDESLINECEKRGTSFKLLIGYAKKPEVGVRRTVSV